MLLTPIFALYEKKIDRMILCYPGFNQHLSSWLPNQSFKGRFISPLWQHLIRDVLSSPVTELKNADLGNIDTYALETKPDRIKIILLPFESAEVQWRTDFASFLIEHLQSKSKLTMLDHFIRMLQRDCKVEDLINHPLLQGFDSISNLIRITWRERKNVTTEMELLLNSTVRSMRNNTLWSSVTTTDPVVSDYISKTSEHNSFGLFTVIKKIAAHYVENHRKLNQGKAMFNVCRRHPVELIEETWPGAC
uniref:Uncharacterized protein n=2 Tax=Leersia perrieri TaxID=77586 RepID=A0A0D9VCQ5_9ORYZ